MGYNTVVGKNRIFPSSYIDGRDGTRLYRIYYAMKSRCYNDKLKCYNRYGGRGITVCDEWLRDFKNFKDWSLTNGYYDELSIDRINNDGNYEPSNCRWVTSKTQTRNRSNNKLVTINGETKPQIEWCEVFGINYGTVHWRLRNGWTVEDALTKPVKTMVRRNR